MGKKKKIREEFDAIFKSGDQPRIKQMLKKNPWLLSELSSEMSKDIEVQHQVIAAIGVMEDELGHSVKPSEVVTSLKSDFGINKTVQEIEKILIDIGNLGYVENAKLGWSLTGEGEIICDEYLNKFLRNAEYN